VAGARPLAAPTARAYSPLMSEIIAERVMELRESETSKLVTVRVYKPEQHPDREGWTCRIEWSGIGVPPRSSVGLDSAEALFNALEMVSSEVKRHDGLRVPQDDYPGGQKRNPWPIERGAPTLPVAEPLPGDVIMERLLSAPGSDEPTVRFAMHRPQPKGATDWVCWYEIQAPGEPDRRRHAYGTDSAQALLLALLRAKWDVDSMALTVRGQSPWEISIGPLELSDTAQKPEPEPE
jgi:hypothetical protein